MWQDPKAEEEEVEEVGEEEEKGEEDEVAGEWWTCETRAAMKFWVAKTAAKSAYVSSRACETVSRGGKKQREGASGRESELV